MLKVYLASSSHQHLKDQQSCEEFRLIVSQAPQEFLQRPQRICQISVQRQARGTALSLHRGSPGPGPASLCWGLAKPLPPQFTRNPVLHVVPRGSSWRLLLRTLNGFRKPTHSLTPTRNFSAHGQCSEQRWCTCKLRSLYFISPRLGLWVLVFLSSSVFVCIFPLCCTESALQSRHFEKATQPALSCFPLGTCLPGLGFQLRRSLSPHSPPASLLWF